MKHVLEFAQSQRLFGSSHHPTHWFTHRLHSGLPICLSAFFAIFATFLIVSRGHAQADPLASQSSRDDQSAKITVRLELKPEDDPGRFDLRIDNKTVAQAVQDDGHSKNQSIEPGNHVISVVGNGQTNLADYTTKIVCKSEQDDDDEDDHDRDDDDDDHDDDDKDHDDDHDDDDDQDQCKEQDQDQDDDNDHDAQHDSVLSVADDEPEWKVIAQGKGASSLDVEVGKHEQVICTVTNTHRTAASEQPLLQARMEGALAVDADHNGLPSPGDTLEYHVVIANQGNGRATGARFEIALEANTRLVAGTFRSNPDTSDIKEMVDQNAVVAQLGELLAGKSVAFTFRALLNPSAPADLAQVANQGVLKSDQLADVLTDDPTVSGSADPTITPLSGQAALKVTLTDFLFIDVDGNEVVNAGDILLYGLSILNVGARPATEVVVDDQPDGNTTLLDGRVTASQGTILTGNQPGHTQVKVNVGTIAKGARVNISFQLRVNAQVTAPLLTNQALLTLRDQRTGGQLHIVSDDPDTVQLDDPTKTPVGVFSTRIQRISSRLYLPLVTQSGR